MLMSKDLGDQVLLNNSDSVQIVGRLINVYLVPRKDLSTLPQGRRRGSDRERSGAFGIFGA